MTSTSPTGGAPSLRLLAVTQGTWGERIADNVGRFHPENWTVHRWAAPRVLPPVVDDPDDYLPASLPEVDLVLALGETPGLVQLIPDIVTRTHAQAVIAPIDRNESLPSGLVSQLRTWLDQLGVAVVFPKPFCALTETTFSHGRIQQTYAHPLIREYASHFGQPRFRVEVDQDQRVGLVQVERDSACGMARHVAQGLSGCPVTEAEEKAGMLHHHFPCLASMNQDRDYHDTLMHVSGHLLRDVVKVELEPHLPPVPYLRPVGRVDTMADEVTHD